MRRWTGAEIAERFPPGPAWRHTATGGPYVVTGAVRLKMAAGHGLDDALFVQYRRADSPEPYARDPDNFASSFVPEDPSPR